jgi:hypothetical protein
MNPKIICIAFSRLFNFYVKHILVAMMMEAVRTCETPANLYQCTRRYNPEDGHLLLMHHH